MLNHNFADGEPYRTKIALEKWAKTSNAKRISSTIHKNNLPMISLNKDLGYQVKSCECIKILIRIRIMLLIHVKIKKDLMTLRSFI